MIISPEFKISYYFSDLLILNVSLMYCYFFDLLKLVEPVYFYFYFYCYQNTLLCLKIPLFPHLKFPLLKTCPNCGFLLYGTLPNISLLYDLFLFCYLPLSIFLFLSWPFILPWSIMALNGLDCLMFWMFKLFIIAVRVSIFALRTLYESKYTLCLVELLLSLMFITGVEKVSPVNCLSDFLLWGFCLVVFTTFLRSSLGKRTQYSLDGCVLLNTSKPEVHHNLVILLFALYV